VVSSAIVQQLYRKLSTVGLPHTTYEALGAPPFSSPVCGGPRKKEEEQQSRDPRKKENEQSRDPRGQRKREERQQSRDPREKENK